jgi:ribonuclease HI
MTLRIYTDGSCLSNPGPGGWAWAVPEGAFGTGADAHTTNQRMELTAALEALRTVTEPEIEVVSDSTYVVKCFQDRWWAGWKRRGWKNSQGQPVANRDLWEPMLEVALDPSRTISFSWVKGHSGDKWNDVVDVLALEAARSQQGRAGTDLSSPS